MKDTEIRNLADSVLAQFFKGTSFRNAEVHTELAFDGAPYVQVDAHFKHRPKYDIRKRMDAMDAIQTKLFEADDNRFVALSFYSDDEPVIQDEDEDGIDSGIAAGSQ